MLREKFKINVLRPEIEAITKKNIIKDNEIVLELCKYLDKMSPKLGQNLLDWHCFSTFWPPRLVEAYQNDRLICFFGAGLSIPSGIPSWHNLFIDYFGLEPALLSDDDLKTDPLTLAELASHQVGADQLQNIIREAMEPITMPTTTHLITAAMRLPFYITTNYDCLFEKIWKKINPGIDLETIVNESDLIKYKNELNLENPNKNRSFLLKIHGSIDRPDELLILTRSGYRYHYRANREFFKVIIHLLSKYHILFTGFSHRDPEVTRLVEDVIFEYEKKSMNRENDIQEPNLYSLQFSMRLHTPEIFAARGILALSPPVVNLIVKDVRSLSLAQALCDLISAADTNFHKTLSLDEILEKFAQQLVAELEVGLKKLEEYSGRAAEILTGSKDTIEWMEELIKSLGPLAGQGVYLLNDQGNIIEMYLPNGLDKTARESQISFNNRPYFQQAKSFRKPFISDSLKSVYNDFSTIFLCIPLIKNGESFIGLLFSACQIGFWKVPIDLAKTIWNKDKDLSVLLIDSNGTCLIPPNNEFSTENSRGAKGKELKKANEGYKYDKMLRLSKRDKLISRVMQNVVPISQDDDVLSLTSDLKYYTVVTELKTTHWKLGISKPIILAGK